MNSLTLAIINDGKGYAERVALARRSLAGTPNRLTAQSWLALVSDQDRLEQRRYGAEYSLADILESVAELHAYYADHVREIDAEPKGAAA